MSLFLTVATVLFAALYALILIWDLAVSRRWTPVIVQAVLLTAFLLALHFWIGFPAVRYDFSGYDPLWVVVAMLVCVVLGMAAQYLFNLGEDPWKWRPFLRPVVISPIVLLPLLGSVEGADRLSTFQFVSFLFLAFQSGFFWKTVLDKAAARV